MAYQTCKHHNTWSAISNTYPPENIDRYHGFHGFVSSCARCAPSIARMVWMTD